MRDGFTARREPRISLALHPGYGSLAAGKFALKGQDFRVVRAVRIEPKMTLVPGRPIGPHAAPFGPWPNGFGRAA